MSQNRGASKPAPGEVSRIFHGEDGIFEQVGGRWKYVREDIFGMWKMYDIKCGRGGV